MDLKVVWLSKAKNVWTRRQSPNGSLRLGLGAFDGLRFRSVCVNASKVLGSYRERYYVMSFATSRVSPCNWYSVSESSSALQCISISLPGEEIQALKVRSRSRCVVRIFLTLDIALAPEAHSSR